MDEAEAALRKAIAIDGKHLLSLVALAAVHWHNGLTTDTICFEHAEVGGYAGLLEGGVRTDLWLVYVDL